MSEEGLDRPSVFNVKNNKVLGMHSDDIGMDKTLLFKKNEYRFLPNPTDSFYPKSPCRVKHK